MRLQCIYIRLIEDFFVISIMSDSRILQQIWLNSNRLGQLFIYLCFNALWSSFLLHFTDIVEDSSLKMKETVEKIIKLMPQPRNYGE